MTKLWYRMYTDLALEDITHIVFDGITNLILKSLYIPRQT